MASVDEKIVKLSVNNSGFTQKLSESASALQKLNGILAKGLGGGKVSADAAAINSSVSGTKNGLADLATETGRTSKAFDVLRGAAAVALGNIATKVVTTGASMIKSLTMQPLMDGIAEYNLQMGSVQTILANTKSKGEDIKSVTKALDELNSYADLTIYNFGEMTANIGRFTAAGVDLKDSVAAIKGISNLAALSGSSSQQASSAMYQLSQAIASGTVKLMDWNSVVNAGMGGEQFQEALKTTARVHGVAVDELIQKNGSFRDSLQEGWLSSEIMLETLSALTGDLSEAQLREMGYSAEQAKQMAELGQTALHAATEFKTWADVQDAAMESIGSGWAKTFQLIFGDYEESKALWTEVGNTVTGVLDKMGDSRNKFVQGWRDLGGREALINGLRNAFTGLGKVLSTIGDAFKSVFKGISPAQLANMTKSFEAFSKKLIPSEKTLARLKVAFQGFFSILHIGKTIFVEVLQTIGALVGGLAKMAGVGDLGTKFLDAGVKIGGFLVNLDKTVESFDLSAKAIAALKKAVEAVKKFFDSFKSSLSSNFTGLDGFKDKISNAAESIKTSGVDAASGVKDWIKAHASFEGIGKALSTAGTKLGEMFGTLASGIGKALKKIAEVASNFDFGKAFKWLAGGTAVGSIALIAKKFSGLVDTVKDLIGGLQDAGESGGGISDLLDSVKDSLKAWQNSLNAAAILAIAASIAVLTASLVVLSQLDAAALAKGVAAIGALAGELGGSLKALDAMKVSASVSLKAPALIAMASALLILSAAVRILAGLDTGEVVRGTAAVGALALALSGAAWILGQSSAKAAVGAAAAAVLAAAITELAVVAALMGQMDTKKLIKGVAAVSALALAMAGAARLMGNGGSLTGAAAMLAVAGSLVILKNVAEDLAKMEWEGLAKAGASMGLAIAAIVGAVWALNGIKHTKGVAAFAVVCMSLASLTDDIMKLATVPWSSLAKAGLAMGGAVGGVVLAVRLMDKVKRTRGVIAFAAVCASLTLIVDPIMKLATVPWTSLAKSGVAMAGALGGLVLAVKILDKSSIKGAVGAAAIYVIASALQKIVTPVRVLGSMNLQDLAKGLGAVAVFLGAVILAAKGAQGSIPGLLALSGALLVLVPALKGYAKVVQSLGSLDTGTLVKGVLGLAAGLGVFIGAAALANLVIPGLLALSVALVAFGVALLPISLALTAFSTALTVAATVGITAFQVLAQGIMLLIEQLPAMVVAIGEAVVLFTTTLLEGFITVIPLIGETLLLLIQTICTVIIESAPSIGEAIVAVVQMLCTVIIETAPSIGTALTTLITTLCNVVKTTAPTVAETFWTVVEAGLTALANHAEAIATAGANVIINFLNGIAQKIPDIVNSATNVLVNFLNGIANNIPRVANAATNVIVAFITAIGDNLPRIIDAGMKTMVKFVQGLADGIKNNKGKMREAGKNLLWELVNAILMDIPQKCVTLLNKAKDLGKNIVEGIKQGITNAWDTVKNWFGDKVGGLIDLGKSVLGIHSPSREFAEIGKQIPLGVSVGIRKTESQMGRDIEYMGLKALDSFQKVMSDAVDTNLDLSPTVTPVLDLTEFNREAGGMSGKLKAFTGLSASAELAFSAASQRATSAGAFAPVQNIVNNYTYDYDQTIQAPTELDASTIRRDTKGLIAQFARTE